MKRVIAVFCLMIVGYIPAITPALSQGLSLEMQPGQVLQFPLPKRFSKIQVGDPTVIDTIYVKEEPDIITIRGIKVGFSSLIISDAGQVQVNLAVNVVKSLRYGRSQVELRFVNIPPPQVSYDENKQASQKPDAGDKEQAIIQLYYCDKKDNGSCFFDETRGTRN